MIADAFTQSNLYCMIAYIDSSRQASTVNLTLHKTRLASDNKWLANKACHSQVARLDNPTSLTLANLFALLQKKNISALPKVGREPDVIPMTLLQVQLAQQYSCSSSLYSNSCNAAVESAYLIPRINSYQHTPVKLSGSTPGLSYWPGGNSYQPGGIILNPGRINNPNPGGNF